MELSRRIKQALAKAIARSGNMLSLAKQSGVNCAAINRFSRGKSDIGNMTISTLERLFPELEARFFNDEISEKDSDALFCEVKIIWQDLSQSQKHKIASLANELLEETAQKHVERKAVG